MDKVNVHYAKTHLSRLLERVAAGEEIIIAKAGHAVAKLVPYAPARAPRQPGQWRDRVQLSEDFDELPEDIRSAFQGEAP